MTSIAVNARTIALPELGLPRMAESTYTNAWQGDVRWNPVQSLWITGMWVAGLYAILTSTSVENLLVFVFTTGLTLCLGHSLGMHRRFIHRSYECPKALEYIFVWLGVLVGLAGPLGMMRTHDLRDWAQRQRRCHPYFGHKARFLTDAFWQMHCTIHLKHAPTFEPEDDVAQDRVYDFMEKTWMLQQVPVAVILFLAGGVEWVLWGVCLRVAVSVTGHWLIGHFAHNTGRRDWHVEGAAVQGFNIPLCGLITMGECWHNNHHAFPGSAKIGLRAGQTDPGWWVLLALRRFGLVWNLRLPEDLPLRRELIPTATHSA